MKVLFFAPYIYDTNHPEFAKTSSGFGYMVYDILKEVSKYQDVYLITHQFTKGYTEEFNVCKHTRWDVIKNVEFRTVINGLKHMFFTQASLGNRLRYLYYYINVGSVKKWIEGFKPDLVHIHGLTFQTKPIIEMCESMNLKYLVTLHGLNGLEESVSLPKKEKEYELEALKELEKHNTNITVVSSGIKNNIINHYKLSGNNIHVILNGTRLHQMSKIDQVDKVKQEICRILCIGTVGECKNQKQLIHACEFLPEEVKKKIEINIVGGSNGEIDIETEIRKRGLENIIRYRGFVPRQELKSLWETAMLNVVMSKSEGFGLSIIEGYAYGVPTLAFSDIDAIIDLYDEKAMMLIPERTDQQVALSLIKAIEIDWNREYIKEMALKFSMENIGKQYNELYLEYKAKGESKECHFIRKN